VARPELHTKLEVLRRQVDEAEHDWESQARPEQLEPAGEWACFVLLGGRGMGKTKALSEALRRRVRLGLSRESAIVGATAADARDVMIEGPAGILEACTRVERPLYEPSRRRLAWPNGAVSHVYSADEPDRLRGPQHDFAIGDELRAWRYLQEALDNLLLGLRHGDDPRACFATTPANQRPLRDLIARDSTVVTRGSTLDNLANLAPVFRERILARYQGTRLGQQEIEGHLLEDAEDALFRRLWLDGARVDRAPERVRQVVVALDPAEPGEKGSEQALAVVAVGMNGDLYVLASEGHRASVGEFLSRALVLAKQWNARIVVERNHGGAALIEVLEMKMRELGYRVPYSEVWATKGKRARAEGTALTAEQGRLHLVGNQPELEEQLLGFTGQPGEPFDRGDALVWAATELARYRRGLMDGDGVNLVAPYSSEPLEGDQAGMVVRWDDAAEPLFPDPDDELVELGMARSYAPYT